MTVRKAHVEKILDAGNKLGDTSREMNPVLEVLMYAGFWAVCKFACQTSNIDEKLSLMATTVKLFGAFFLKAVQNYDVVVEVEKVRQQ